MTHIWKSNRLAACLALGAGTLVTGCANGNATVFSPMAREAMANAAYTASYNGNASYRPASGYTGPYWTPQTFSRHDGWPASYAYGDVVGANQCQHTDSFYTCDTNNDGLADMYGNTDDGSYASPALRVNAQGEAFTWGADCTCWQRSPAYDGARQPGQTTIRGEREQD